MLWLLVVELPSYQFSSVPTAGSIWRGGSSWVRAEPRGTWKLKTSIVHQHLPKTISWNPLKTLYCCKSFLTLLVLSCTFRFLTLTQKASLPSFSLSEVFACCLPQGFSENKGGYWSRHHLGGSSIASIAKPIEDPTWPAEDTTWTLRTCNPKKSNVVEKLKVAFQIAVVQVLWGLCEF